MSARTVGVGVIAFLVSAFMVTAPAQTPAKSTGPGATRSAKSIDTTKKTATAPDVPQCASGMVLIPASLANPATASPVASAAAGMPTIPSIPSPTSFLANAAKNKLLKKGDSVPVAPTSPPASTTPTAQFLCVTPAQAQTYLQSAQNAASAQAAPTPEQAAAAQKDAMKSAVTGVLAATPQGMLVSGAVAAAPSATGAVKSLAGRFSRGESKDGMIKDLRQGRLQVKGIRFVDGSDEMAEGFEQTIAMLGDALQSVDGQFALIVPAESDGKSPPDVETARRRMAKLAAHLQLAGIAPERLVVADDAIGAHTPGGRTVGAHMSAAKAPKIGEARVEIVRVGGAKP